MSTDIPRLFRIAPWTISEDTFSTERSLVAESIFSLANEYMGTRGTFEEGVSNETMPGNYIGGIYCKTQNEYVWKRKAFPEYGNFMINTTDYWSTIISVAGEAFSMESSTYDSYSRTLDMKTGTLSRSVIFETKTGQRTHVEFERFLSHADKHAAALRVTATALNHTMPISISFGLDSTKENTEFATALTHGQMMSSDVNDSGAHILMKIKTTGTYYIHRMNIRSLDEANEKTDTTAENRAVRVSKSFTPKQGVPYRFDKIVSVWTSRDAGHPFGLIPKNSHWDEYTIDSETEKNILDFLIRESDAHGAALASFDDLKKSHIDALTEKWKTLDIEIEGDDAAQQGIRYCMFQLMNSYMGNDPHLNIGAKGYTGETYNGRAFWDSESYCFSFYALTNPKAAKHLLLYRYNTLPQARERAAEFGYDGAIYPLMTIDGTEDCGVWEYMIGEIHINAIMAYAVYLYEQLTGSKEYTYSNGIDVLVEQARFWASRVTYIEHRNAYCINRVTGPDEYSQWANNNFYTNYMAKWLLGYAADTVAEMETNESNDVLANLNIGSDETERWRTIAEHMRINYDEEKKLYPQDDMFFDLDPVDKETLTRDNDIPIERKWTIDKIWKRDIIKQPDVLLTMFLMRDAFTREEKYHNYKYYEQRTVHGSSLSPCIHSILANEIGLYNQAYEYSLWSSRLDLDNFNNNTEEGLHISSMSGTWLNVVFGFGGLTIREDALSFEPTIPEAWRSYKFTLNYRGRTIALKVTSTDIEIQTVSGEAIPIVIYGDAYECTSSPKRILLPESYTEHPKLEAVVFDLDGVIVDTAKYHYRAWKALADEEGIYFDERINERLKGVSRMDSLRIIMERAERTYTDDELAALAAKKNERYKEMLRVLTPSDMLPGINDFLDELASAGIRTAICSASKNTDAILEHLQIRDRFDAVVTGNDVTQSKPDPEGMTLAATRLSVAPAACAVIEDAAAGVEAAIGAGMKSIGIGSKRTLHRAGAAIVSTVYLSLARVQALF